MIYGNVVGLQARIGVILRLPGGSDVEIEFVVDTGFEGALTLPPTTIAALGLPYLTQLNANLANDMNVVADVYVATVVWNGVERDIAVLAMGRRPLVGTALLEDYHLSVDFYEGGSVLVDDIL
ncbi:clan AA aspartic protease [Argonema galeatum]|uniref:clan AA aspartic protease n=1 Tax=Argonema galeatum TaxID=2942762 RepID=UPI0020128307|nr:clan AA aspartic protease [Argonema galeatum]MCL1463899.1 clan AA aspartic protease [Argonema galeatum A003/A1]